MLSGRRLDLLNPSPLDIEISDIAHGLARVARWNGQTKGDHALSVAQHCVLVHDIAVHMDPALTQAQRLAALLHDAPEYVVGDMISPFKAALGLDYKDFENRLLAAIHIRFGLSAATPPKLGVFIKNCDRLAAYLESTQLAGFSTAEAEKFFGKPKDTGLARRFALKPLPPNDASDLYLKTFRKLMP
jgi:5'-deoxynucleotidase YfbR-like HD superfamily hydrolase